MRTRCSSIPSADTLVKPAGSTRVTLAERRAAPALDAGGRRPRCTLTASTDSNSTTSSRLSGSPISSSGVPATTTRSLSWMSRRTRPLTGARTVTQHPSRHLSLPGSPPGRSAAPARFPVRACARPGWLWPRQRACLVSTSMRARSRARSEMVLVLMRAARALSSLWANSSSAAAWLISASASATAALAASSCASSSRVARTSRNAGAIGSIMATIGHVFLDAIARLAATGARACR